MIYYILIAGLAAYSGINAISAFKQALAGSASHISLAALETAMTSVKASEVITFLSSLGIKVAK
jgi:chaperone required for assembly of F1-ATPase